jgi:hypothetical protein
MSWLDNIVEYLKDNNHNYDMFKLIKVTIENYDDTRNFKAYITQRNKWPLHLEIVYDNINKIYLGIKIDIEYQDRLSGFPYLINDSDLFIRYLDKCVELNSLNIELRDFLVKMVKN